MTGRMYNETLGRAHFFLTFVAFNLTFFPQHYIGLRGMPRRVADYDPQFHEWNMVSSIGAFMLGFAALAATVLIAFWLWRRSRQPPDPPSD
jgi:cytochrome c oxidase subunit 1